MGQTLARGYSAKSQDENSIPYHRKMFQLSCSRKYPFLVLFMVITGWWFMSSGELSERKLIRESGLKDFFWSLKPAWPLLSKPALDKIRYMDKFQPVDDTNHTFVFSAYVDEIPDKSIIRILAVTLRNKKDTPKMNCSIKHNDGKSRDSLATVVGIREHHGMNYTAAFILCDLTSSALPLAVSVYSASSGDVRNTINVRHFNRTPEFSMAHCLAPIQNDYNNLYQFIEFIAVNRVFGVEHFTIYNHSVSQNITRALNVLVNIGLIEVVNWDLPDIVTNDIHYCGQLVALNDCLYRYRGRSQLVVNSDLDEFIIPRKTNTLVNAINQIVKQHPKFGIFYARSYIFSTQFKDSEETFTQRKMAEKYKSVTLLKTNRTVLPLPSRIRQKYVFDPLKAVTLGIHFEWKLGPGFKNKPVSPEVLSLNHYRRSLVGTYRKGVNDTFTLDSYMLTFQNDIVQKLTYIWAIIQNENEWFNN